MVADERYARTLAVDGEHGRGRASRRRTGDFLVGARSAFPEVAALPAVIARIRRVFDLTADPGLIGEHLSQDPALAPLVAARPGLRAPGAWDGFELAVRAILGQQITVTAARGLAAKLVAGLRRAARPAAAASADGLTRVFPRPGVWSARTSPRSACRRRAARRWRRWPHGRRRSDDLQPRARPGEAIAR